MGSRSKQQQPEPSTSTGGGTGGPDDSELTSTVRSGIDFGINNVKKFIHETLPKCSTDERKQDMAARMEKLVLRLVKAEMSFTRATQIAEEVGEEMPVDDDSEASAILKACDDIADISMKRINAYDKSLKEEDLKQNETYIKLMKDMQIQLTAKPREDVQQDSDDDDDDDEDEESEEEVEMEQEDLIPTTDPITKKQLTDPVRNKKCGHIYGKASITQLIRRNNKTRCPIPGCSNKDFLRVGQLVADKQLTAEVKKRQSEAKKSKRR